jgi:hypothetical protein
MREGTGEAAAWRVARERRAAKAELGLAGGLSIVFFMVGCAVFGDLRGGVRLALIPVVPAVLVVWRYRRTYRRFAEGRASHSGQR